MRVVEHDARVRGAEAGNLGGEHGMIGIEPGRAAAGDLRRVGRIARIERFAVESGGRA